MINPRKYTSTFAGLILLSMATLDLTYADSISINFMLKGGDQTSVDSDEHASQLAAGGQWNNIRVRSGDKAGPVDDGFAGASIALVNGAGAEAATLNNTVAKGGGYAEFAQVTDHPSTLNASGEAGLMQSHLSFGASSKAEMLKVSGLGPAFTKEGYTVYAYFDFNGARTYGFTVDDGTPSDTFWTADNTADSDTDEDGKMEWVHASGKTAATATPNANYAVFTGLNGSTFTMRGVSTNGRAILSGLQIVSGDHPTPPEIKRFTSSAHYVRPGSQVTLSWESLDAEQLKLEPGGRVIQNGSGSTQVNVDATTTYTLTAINEVGTTSQSIRVGVGPARPNILFFLVDDMGWQDTSVPFQHDADGKPVISELNKRYRTPHMEALAARGMKFTSAYACSVCTPTRVSIMTGMNAARHHVTTWTHPSTPMHTGSNQIKHLAPPPEWRMAGMDENDIALPALLQEAGYRTIHAGKAHFGANGTFSGNPQDIGFDVNIAGHGAGGPGSYLGTENFGEGIWHIPGLEAYHGKDIFATEALTLEMNKAIESAVQDGTPFFAYMAHYAVHGRFMVDKRFADHYPELSGNQKAFATMIEGMDQSLGDIIAKIEALGVAENTLVIFLSDNGGDMTNTPLKAKKGTRYEGGIRVPMIVGWAKPNGTNPFQVALSIPAGSRQDGIVACWDMFPTVAGIAGIPYAHTIDGHDLRPYFRGTPGTHRPQEFIMHFPHAHNHDFFSVIRRKDWKLVYNYGDQSHELYNVVNDLSETTNLANAEPERVKVLVQRLAQGLEEMDAQYPMNTQTNREQRPE
ncbi:MAG: arylsulfatase A-like enzyme [Candidatus Omnitrophota bacterium]|jgi:arylsulfatase A-like enzyme